ncbi:Uncharacterised protein [BD1-7 clade bacterium]|uniref:DUF3108 domain-containing protein n=1 Tax=BD1-7 clade bacterium TaxID=2029982 RepID=A0A5S9QU22_9GAMM|nr:Uncharacterised protein [BD1-7 clade bacterium]
MGIRKSLSLTTVVITMLLTSTLAAGEPFNSYRAVYIVNYGPLNLGKAHYNLQKADGGDLKLVFDSKLELLLLNDKRHITSEFRISDDQLIPLTFSQDRKGTGKDYREEIAFAHHEESVDTLYSSKKKRLKLEHPTFDPLNAQVKMRLDLSREASLPQRLEYTMVLENKFDSYAFKYVGEETLTIDGIDYRTVKFEVDRKDKRKNTWLWFAKDLDYLPIKLEHRQKNREAASMTLISYEEFDDDGEKLLAINHEYRPPSNRSIKKRFRSAPRR